MVKAAPPDAAALAAMVRVNHAGEYGALRIYAGQLAVLDAAPRTRALATATKKMAKQEARHLKDFEDELRARALAPTCWMPLWHELGYAAGALSALVSEEAAHACTEAVEEVIDEHYRAQRAALKDNTAKDEQRLAKKIARAHEDELEHRDFARASGAHRAPGYRILHASVRAACKFAIGVSSKM